MEVSGVKNSAPTESFSVEVLCGVILYLPETSWKSTIITDQHIIINIICIIIIITIIIIIITGSSPTPTPSHNNINS
jgi:hypothetical protein